MSASKLTTAAPQFASIQILRAVAAWMVVCHHHVSFYGETHSGVVGALLWDHGAFGVDIFFVISGFIMHKSIQRRSQSAGGFLRRRLVRIVPNYWFWTMVMGACCVLAPAAYACFGQPTVRSVIGSLFFVPHENPSGLGIYPLLTVGWTLNYEMVFYGLFAACLLLPQRWTSLAAISILLLLVPLESLLSGYGAVVGPWQWLQTGFLLEFAFGISLGILHDAHPPRHRCWRLAAPLVIAASVVWVVLGGRTQLPATAIVWAALSLESRSTHPLSRLAQHFGDTSYSTYLCHPIIQCAAFALTGSPPSLLAEALVFVVMLAVVAGVSELSYRVIERRRVWARLASGLGRTVRSPDARLPSRDDSVPQAAPTSAGG